MGRRMARAVWSKGSLDAGGALRDVLAIVQSKLALLGVVKRKEDGWSAAGSSRKAARTLAHSPNREGLARPRRKLPAAPRAAALSWLQL